MVYQPFRWLSRLAPLAPSPFAVAARQETHQKPAVTRVRRTQSRRLEADIEQVPGCIREILIQPEVDFGGADTAVPKAQLHLPQVCPSLVG